MIRHAITDVLVLAAFGALAWGLSALIGITPGLARWGCAALLFLMLAGGYIEPALPWWRKRLFRDRRNPTAPSTQRSSR